MIPAPVLNPPPAQVAFVGSNSSGTDAASYTFTAQGIGVARGDRRVVVAVSIRSANPNITITGVTVGGVAATQVASAANSNIGVTTSRAELWAVDSFTGTTADIVVSCSGSCARCAISVYNLYALAASAPVSTGTHNASLTSTLNSTVTKERVGIACAFGNAVGPLFTWVGLTEDVDIAVEAISAHSSASLIFSTDEARTITATASSGAANEQAGCIAIWR